MNETPQWEAGKENAAPLRRGRRVGALEQSLSNFLDDDTRISNELQIVEYERLVRRSEIDGFVVDEGDDPLTHWTKYIQFYQDSFPSDTINQLKLVERCFRAICKLSMYKNDERFIKICCVFADKSKRPHDIFKYCHEQKIGVELAIFWIAWAYVAEKDENFPFAEKIYEKGIRKKAVPLKLLQQRLKHFQRRMSRHWLNSTQNDEMDDNEGLISSRQTRGILGALDEDAVARNDRSRNPFVNQNRRQPRSHSPGTAPSMAPFPIFKDDNIENLDPILDTSQTNSSFRSFVRSEEVIKENTLGPSRWNQYGSLSTTAIYSRRQPVMVRSSPSKPFSVYVDKHCVEQNNEIEAERATHEQTHRQTRDDRTFREHKGSTVAEKLTQDPLRYVKDPNKLAKDHPTITLKQLGPQYKTKDTLPSLKYKFTSDKSCEEERFQAGCYKILSSGYNFNQLCSVKPQIQLKCKSPSENRNTTNPQIAKSAQIYEEIEDCFCKDNIHEMYTNQGHLFRQYNSPTPRNSSTASSTVEEAMAVGIYVPPIEQTINTAWAQKEISMMFFGSPTKEANHSFASLCTMSDGKAIIKRESRHFGMAIIPDDRILIEESCNDPNSSFANISFNNIKQEVSASTERKPIRLQHKSSKPENTAAPFQIYEDTSQDYPPNDVVDIETKSTTHLHLTGTGGSSEHPASLHPKVPVFQIYNDLNDCNKDISMNRNQNSNKKETRSSKSPSFDNNDLPKATNDHGVAFSFSDDYSNIVSMGEKLLNDSGDTATWSVLEDAFKEV
jgi:Mad3/BUB1 homology region 1